MPKATRRSAAAPAASNNPYGGDQGNANSYQNAAHSSHSNHNQKIIVHDHDVLNGRGVNMAHHPGNMRFRTLIQTRSDPAYCSSYTLAEKKALAEEVVQHIAELDPPGRFLKRAASSKSKQKRGFNVPWELMSREEAVKKARQALRDCNRPDRDGYAKSVTAPSDVVESAKQRKSSGLTQQQYIQQMVAADPPSASNSAASSGRTTPNAAAAAASSVARHASTQSATTPAPAPVPLVIESKVAPTVASDPTTSWIPEKPAPPTGYTLDQNDSLDTQTTPVLRNSTPTTAGTSVGGFFPGDSEYFTEPSFQDHHHDLHENNGQHHHGLVDVAGAPSLDSPSHPSHFAHGLSASPAPAASGFIDPFEETLDDEDTKPRAVSSFHPPDPLQEEEDAAALTSAFGDDEDFAAAFAGEKHLF